MITPAIVLGVAGFVFTTIIASFMLRTVVRTNMVHVVQSRRKTTPYGTGQSAGNVYFRWPSWIPSLGVTVIKLPVSNFDLSLLAYEAYDRDRVPFIVDVTAFFRIEDTAVAARRVVNVTELEQQLSLIVQGAVRKVLADDVIDSIMLERAKFGNAFTKEIGDQLKEWGVQSVKSMELMDIRDGEGSRNVTNIMAKKTSFIEMESRTEVAENTKKARTAEIESQQVIDVRAQEAAEAVGQRTAEKDKAVGIAQQQSRQEVLTQEKLTQERTMAVHRVERVKQEEIEKDRQLVVADQDKQTRIIRAEGELEAQQKEAEAIRVVGVARADAEKAMKLAPVMAQIELAKEIGANDGYQQYLAMLEAIKAHIVVGQEQAQALQTADVKVIANTGNASEGMSRVMDLFSSKGGTNLAAMVEAFAQTPLGTAVLDQMGVKARKSEGVPENTAPEKSGL